MAVIDALFQRKKLVGLILLAVGAVLAVKGQMDHALELLGISVMLLAYLCIITGVVLIALRLSQRRGLR